MKKLILLSTFCFLLSVAAAQGALIPCRGLECQNFCQLTELVGKVINFGLKYIAVPLSVVLIVWGGLMMILESARGNPEKAKSAKDIITAAIIGLIIALAAWLILSTLLQILTGSGFSPWELGSASFCK